MRRSRVRRLFARRRPASCCCRRRRVRGADDSGAQAAGRAARDARPVLSVWSMGDRLADDRTKHGRARRTAWSGWRASTAARTGSWGSRTTPARAHEAGRVGSLPDAHRLPLRGGRRRARAHLHEPLLPDDLEVMSRPVTYLTWEVRSADGRAHQVSLYFDCTAELAVNTADQKVIWTRAQAGALSVLGVGSQQQPSLRSSATTCASTGATSIWPCRPPQCHGDRLNQTARRAFARRARCPTRTTCGCRGR